MLTHSQAKSNKNVRSVILKFLLVVLIVYTATNLNVHFWIHLYPPVLLIQPLLEPGKKGVTWKKESLTKNQNLSLELLYNQSGFS